MELDVFEILLRHAQYIARIGQEYVAPFAVFGHILVLALLEILQFFGVVRLYPTGFVQVNGFPTAFGIVLILKSILDDFELKLAYRADDFAPIELVDEELCHAFVHQLFDTLVQLLGLHGVVVLDILEHLWRERWQAAEV